jgi:hypothetical protein
MARSKRPSHLYFIQSDVTGHIKIGRSVDPQRRIRALQTGSPHKLKLVHYFEGLGWREPALHEELSRWRVEGEWFHPDCIGSIPVDLYQDIPWGALDEWWRDK